MSHQVTIEPTGETIEVGEDQTVLDAALRAGVYLPHACVHGLCGTCKVEVLEGEVDHGDASPFALMDMERAEGMSLTCTATPLSDLVVEADIEVDDDARSIPVRDFAATVTRIEAFTPRIIGIFLAVDKDTIDFQAGQYINLHVPGVDKPRAFSIASSPSDSGTIELNVCLVPGGEATTWLHANLEIGDRLEFSGPYGRFFVRISHPEAMLFLAGGSGLSSPKSMIIEMLERGTSHEITLVYGARTEGDLYYRELFEELAAKHANFTYVPALSDEPDSSGWSGHRGFVDAVAAQLFDGRFAGMKAYICGPPPMVDACVSTLMKGRLFERDMYMENFFDQSSTDTRVKSPLFKSI
ncbi:MAG: 2Fe-2S iron-sulfur cluster binding domain-containing protein [Actinobacteria bacterium]|nr:2Fe-2S iron-sulfur cluster binding domain-containing protein [Actinomycetota bacterium]